MTFDIATHIHPELQSLVPQLLPMTANGPLTLELLPSLRLLTPPFIPAPKSEPRWEARTIPGLASGSDVRVLIINPSGANAAPRPAILHMHGGGYVVGSAEATLWRTQELAEALDCLVVSTDYRLAPETVFPGALEDNYAALAWLYRCADELRVDPARIALVGESAGGGHAAMLAIAARDRGDIPVAFQALIYPMLDDRTGSAVRVPPHRGAVLWNAERNRFGWNALLGVPAGSSEVPVGAVPARVADLTGLPPTWIGVGSSDLFFDEDVEYARRLADAGVPVRLNVVPGAFHIFDAWGALSVSRAFRDDLIASLRLAFR